MESKSCKSHCNGGVGLWRCARGKCIPRVADRIVMVASTWLCVVGLRRCCGVKVDFGRDFNRKVKRK